MKSDFDPHSDIPRNCSRGNPEQNTSYIRVAHRHAADSRHVRELRDAINYPCCLASFGDENRCEVAEATQQLQEVVEALA